MRRGCVSCAWTTGFTRLVVAAAGEDLMVRMFGHGFEVLYKVRAVELTADVLVMVAIARHEPGLSLKAVDT